MAKPDWGELQQRFLSDYAKTGISPKDWCEAQGLNYASAKRYIKIANSQKKTAKGSANSQKQKAAAKRSASKSPARHESPKNTISPETKRAPYNARPGNQSALKHGGYARRMLFSDDVIEDANALSLDDELLQLRARNLTAAANIGRWIVMLEDADEDERQVIKADISSAEKAMDRNTARIESLEYTKASISYRDAKEGQSRLETAQRKSFELLESERRKLANDKLKAEITQLQNGGNDDTIVVHGGLPVPGGT